MLARLFAVVLLLLVPLVAAAPGPAPSDLPQSDRYVYAELGLAQPNLTSLTLTGDMWAYRYDVNGKIYDADDISQAFFLQNKYAGEPSGDAFVGSLETAIRTGLNSMLTSSFPDAQITGVTATVERAALAAPTGNPYDPPVHVTVTASIARTAESVGLGTLSDAAVAAVFAAGARVHNDFTLSADPGYNMRYAIGAPATPSGLRFSPTTGVSGDGSTFAIAVDNTDGAHPSTAASATLADGSVSAPTAEDIRSAIDVTMGEIQKGAAGIPIKVAVSSEVRALDVSKRFPDVLPAKVDLSFVNADGVRALRATNAITAADLKKADDALIAQVRSDIERAFGPGATVVGGLSAADVARAAAAKYAPEPPLHFSSNATTTYIVAGADADDIDLALRVGGTADVDLNLFASNGKATTFTVHPTSIGEFTAADKGTVSADHLTATFTVPASAAEFPATVSMRGKGVPDFSKEKAQINVLVDIVDVDAGVGKAFSGDLGTMLVDITVNGDLNVIKVPDELRGSLPAKLKLEYLSADAIRLLVDRGYITAENLTKLETSLADQVAEKLGAALGGKVPVISGLDKATLAASLVKTPISSDTPVVFHATAHVAKPLSGGPLETSAAIALYTKQLPLTLPKIQDLDTVYTVVAPRGLAFSSVTGEGVETGKSADGRDQFTVRPSGDSAQVTASVAVTPTFILLKFWPLVLLAVLLLVLIVGTPIALVVMKKRKGKSATAPKPKAK